MPVSRRDFLTSAAAGSVAFGLSTDAQTTQSSESKNTEKHAAKLPATENPDRRAGRDGIRSERMAVRCDALMEAGQSGHGQG